MNLQLQNKFVQSKITTSRFAFKLWVRVLKAIIRVSVVKLNLSSARSQKNKGHFWYLLCNSQPNCTKNGHLSAIVPKSKISFLSLIFSTIYYTRCQKVLKTIKHFSCPWKWKLQPCCFVLKIEHVYCCLEWLINCDSKFETYFK